MSSGVFKSLSVRFAVLFSAIFALSAAVSFTILFVFLSRHLKRSDRSIIEAKWNEYESVLQTSNLDSLKLLISRERLREGDIPLLVQVLSADGKTELLKVPEDSSKALTTVTERLNGVPLKQGWSDILSPHDHDRIDLLTGPLPSGGHFLRIGKSSDPRDDLLEDLTHLFLGVSVLFVLLGSAMGVFFSRRALAPLRGLILTMNQVCQGSLSSRVPAIAGPGEMAELSGIFNQMLERVEGLVRGMRETLDNVAHDIRTPMARIRASAEVSLLKAPGAHDREALEDCAENADSVVSILNSLLILAEAEAGSAKLKKERTALSEILRPVIDLYEIVAEEKSIVVSFQSPFDPEVVVDRTHLKQAFGNVLDNAIKYSPAGTAVLVSLELGPDSVLVHVQDQGDGIHPDDLPRIWERLFRADRSRSMPGMGIGLSIVRALLRLHGGDAYAESQAGAGSRFTLRIPRG